MKMKKVRQLQIITRSASGLLALLCGLAALPALAQESCAKFLPAAPASPSGAAQATADCGDYQTCLSLGQQVLRDGSPNQAIAAFKRALHEPGLDETQKANAYACIGVAYEFAPDNVLAEAYFERAESLSGGGWIGKEHKRLLSTQSLLLAEDMERKLQAKKDMQSLESAPTMPDSAAADTQAEKEQLATGESGESMPGAEGRTADMGRQRGIKAGIAEKADPTGYDKLPAKEKLQAKLDTTDHSPKPAAKPAAKKKAERHQYTAPAKLTKSGLSQEPSLDIRINFESGSANLTPEGERQADELGKALQKILRNGNQQAVLVGHTDVFGSEQFNVHLSEDRAAAVKAYLSKTYPELADKLSERGVGKSQPLYNEVDDESQRLNRRVEVKLGQVPE